MKNVALLEEGEIHHLDHLGVLAAKRGVLLLVLDELSYQLGKKYYPGLDVRLVSRREVLPQALAREYDCIWTSNFWDKKDFQEYFANVGKQMHFLYCPHGHSDKGQNYHWLERFKEQEVALVYGSLMIDVLKAKNALPEHYEVVGNYRYQYYLEHKAFYDALVPGIPPGKKVVLYAPTWNEGESSIFQAYERVLKNVPDSYFLIVKLHPALEREHLGFTLRLKENRKNVFFLSDFPPIYPLLNRVDYYLGDFSSIGYDFLVFNKPLFFILPNNCSPSFLMQCGTIIQDGYSIYEQLQGEDLFEEQRKKLCKLTFS